MTLLRRSGKGSIQSQFGETCHDWEGESIDGYVDLERLFEAYLSSKRQMKGEQIVTEPFTPEKGRLLVARIAGEINLAKGEDRERIWECPEGRRCHSFLLNYKGRGEGAVDLANGLHREYRSDINRDTYVHLLKVHPSCDNSDFCNRRLVEDSLGMRLKGPRDYNNFEKFKQESLRLVDNLIRLYGRPWEIVQSMLSGEKGQKEPAYCCDFLYPSALR